MWYYDVDMAEEGQFGEGDLDLARTEGPDLASLECPSVTEVRAWIKAARSGWLETGEGRIGSAS